MEGILLVDKPSGWTSHDVVAKTRRILGDKTHKKVKVGHTGTLDPMATGLLILVIGGYTKRASEFSKLDKKYEAELTLGSISDTGDADGKISQVNDSIPSSTEVEKAVRSFVGELKQLPPAYSAIKIDGQRAYKLARTGRAVKLEARTVTIYSIEDLIYDYPKVSFTVSVSSGTYVRSLAADIGAKLGVGAYLSSLRRIEVGDFSVKNAKILTKVTISDIMLPSK
jgi:tRNA pseudouridine55 synthase